MGKCHPSPCRLQHVWYSGGDPASSRKENPYSVHHRTLWNQPFHPGSDGFRICLISALSPRDATQSLRKAPQTPKRQDGLNITMRRLKSSSFRHSETRRRQLQHLQSICLSSSSSNNSPHHIHNVFFRDTISRCKEQSHTINLFPKAFLG